MPEVSERSLFVRRPALRWAVPALVLLVVVGVGSLSRILTADAAPSLPPRSAAQLLVDLQTTETTALSGTVVQKSDLGLPSLPSNGPKGSADFTSMLTGSHTLRVWYAGEDKQRVALLGSLGESDLVRNGADVWLWSSDAKKATHTKVPADAKPSPTQTPNTPQQAAAEALARISPSTTVTTDGTAQVAGRAAYELVLVPKESASRIGQVRLAIDAEKKVPLRVRVYARGASKPAFEVGFTQVSFAQPDAAQFRFTPPPGVTVTEQAAGTGKEHADSSVRVVGSGWTSVLVAKANLESSTAGHLLDSFPKVSGAWGSGRLIRSDLVCALVTDDGRVIAGAVAPELLYRVAAQ